MNLPNKLTIFRFVLVPVFMVFLLIPAIPYNYLFAGIVFVLASVTDFLDGYIARKYNLITDFGKLMDPLADKALTASALICFIELGLAPSFLVAIIIIREFAVSAVRLVAATSKEKTVVPAVFSGKLKTAFTMFTIVLILLFEILRQFGLPLDANITSMISQILLYITTALTIYSGIQIFMKSPVKSKKRG